MQVLARDLLAQRRTQLTALRRSQRFAFPFTQLEDLLDKVGPSAVGQARGEITDADRDLVTRLLNRELDQT